MNKRAQRRNNITSKRLKGLEAETTDLEESLLTEHSTRQRGRKHRVKSQFRRLIDSSTTDVSSLTKELIESGQALYINVMGEKDEEIVKPMSIEQLQFMNGNKNQLIKQGGDNEFPSRLDQSVLGYTGADIPIKSAHHRIRGVLQGKHLPNRGDSSQSHRLFYATTKQLFDEPSSEADLTNITNIEPRDRSKDILLSRKSLGLELYRRERRLTELSQEKDEQLSKWMQKYRQHKKMQPTPTIETIESKRASIQLQNTDKYNIGFIEYLKKKTNRKIEKDLIDKVISRRDNVVEQYQDYIMKQLTLGSRNKENVRKCFDEINRETRHLFL